MNDLETLNRLLENPDLIPDKNWVIALLDKYPSFFIPSLLLLSRNTDGIDAESLDRMRKCIVMNCPDRQAIVDAIDLCDADWGNFYPKEEIIVQKDTEETIDTFIETYGHTNTPEEDAVLERLIFNPVPPDYFSEADIPFDPDDPLALPPELLPEDQRKAIEDSDDDPEPALPTEVAEVDEISENNASDPSLMESLAKIYIKQGRYSRAFEIISKLSLNYPEKSVYFADQLRFLQKLIINQNFLTDKK